MRGLLDTVPGLVTAAVALVVAGGLPTEPPAVIALAAALIPGGFAIGKAIGHLLDTIGTPPRIRNRRGRLLSWERFFAAVGTIAGTLGLLAAAFAVLL